MKQRAGGKYKRRPSHGELADLKRSWETNAKKIPELADLMPVGAVTLLEVFLRRWLESLIDAGAPYVERASKLNLNLKFDFPIARGLQGGIVTFGEVFAHSVSLSEMSSICSTFDKILDGDLFKAIRDTRDRWDIQMNGGSNKPIISDIEAVRSAIARLLEIRHIIVHELPLERPSTDEELSSIVDNVILFMRAADEHFANLIYPDYPLTQREMNEQAAQEHTDSQSELEEICAQIQNHHRLKRDISSANALERIQGS
ncbi:hypothetical protein ACVWWO_006058 [Bradyrhizobium sp. F1.13.1]